MKNSEAKRARLAKPLSKSILEASDDVIEKEIAGRRAEREALQIKREDMRQRVVALSSEIAQLEALGPVRKLQRKLGGIDPTRGSGDVSIKLDPAKLRMKPGRARAKA